MPWEALQELQMGVHLGIHFWFQVSEGLRESCRLNTMLRQHLCLQMSGCVCLHE